MAYDATPHDAIPHDAITNATAQSVSFLAASLPPGLSDELVIRETWDDSGDFYIRIWGEKGDWGENGDFDLAHSFILGGRVIDSACVGVTLTKTNPALVYTPSRTPRTLILTNTARLKNQDGSSLTPTEANSFRTALQSFGAAM
jgi:hypothetical protein